VHEKLQERHDGAVERRAGRVLGKELSKMFEGVV
jgi:hypothetical protein